MEIKVRRTTYGWAPFEVEVDLTEFMIDFIDNITHAVRKDPKVLDPLMEAAYRFVKIKEDNDENDLLKASEDFKDEFESLVGIKPVLGKYFTESGYKFLITKLTTKLKEIA